MFSAVLVTWERFNEVFCVVCTVIKCCIVSVFSTLWSKTNYHVFINTWKLVNFSNCLLISWTVGKMLQVLAVSSFTVTKKQFHYLFDKASASKWRENRPGFILLIEWTRFWDSTKSKRVSFNPGQIIIFSNFLKYRTVPLIVGEIYKFH